MTTMTLVPLRVTPTLRYTHLLRLSDQVGLFEHAEADTPRREHGYCVDDAARGLVVTVREPHQTLELAGLTGLYLHFLVKAITPDGRVHNRMNASGRWTDEPAIGDWWGRSVWAMGVAAAVAPMADTRAEARASLRRLAQQRSSDVRAMSFAALGAGELLLAGIRDSKSEALLRDCLRCIPVMATAGWGWPEPRLRYANGSLAEAVIIGGMALHDRSLIRRGTAMLGALLDIETHDGHISVTGTADRGPADRSPLFDQQAIEVAALADAALRAFDATGDSRWLAAVRNCWMWFLGDNDVGTAMVDLDTGAGFDGLEPDGRNDNRGAESTLAALSTWQDAVILERIEAAQ